MAAPNDLPRIISVPPGSKILRVKTKVSVLCQCTTLAWGAILTDLRHNRPENQEPLNLVQEFEFAQLATNFASNLKLQPFPQSIIPVTVLYTQFRGINQGVEIEGSLQIDGGQEYVFEYKEPFSPVDPGITHSSVSYLVP